VKKYSKEVIMSSHGLINALWLGGLALQALLVFVLLTKKIWRSFPIFLSYSVFNFVIAGLLFAVHRVTAVYFWTYWVTEGVGLLLGFGVVYEVFGTLFLPHPALKRLARTVFRWSLAGLIILSCIVVYTHPPTHQNGLTRAVLVFEEATRIVEVGLLMFLFLFSSAFGLHWRQHVFGISLGLGIFVAIELIAVTMRLQFGVATNPTFNLLRMVSFNASLLIWLGYIAVPERVTSRADVPQPAQLEQWNQAVMELIHR
jgi:hypothetical protein